MPTDVAQTILIGGDTLFREGLSRIFEGTQLNVTSSLQSLDEASIEEVALDRFQLVLLLDVPSDQATPLAALDKLCARCAGARIVVLASDGHPERLIAAATAGVHGYLPRHISPGALLQSISLVMLGESVFSMRAVLPLIRNGACPTDDEAPRTQVATPGTWSFTERERDILGCLVEGQSNKLIAKRLGTTEATIKVQVARLLNKIGAANRTQAATLALGMRV